MHSLGQQAPAALSQPGCLTAPVPSAGCHRSRSSTAGAALANGWPILIGASTGDRATAEGQITDADREHWEVRVVEILGDVEPDYRARLQLEGHWEPTPWPETPALRWTVYLVGGREGLRFALYDTFSQERANHFAQTVIDMLLGEPSETHHRWSAYAS